MNQLNLEEVENYVQNNIGLFHKKRIESLSKLKLTNILKRKNPYLFKAKNVLTAHEIVKGILDSFLSSQEETIFGEFLEGLAIFVCKKVFNGQKSSAEGIDLEFEKYGIKYIASIKSGPNWGNSSQQKRMKDNFKKAKRILQTNTNKINIVAINGCCYGKDNKPDKGDYLKLCGQDFWEFISGNEKLFIEIIDPIGHKAKVRNEEFQIEYSRLINIFTQEFSKEFCDEGLINWKRLVKFNSEKKETNHGNQSH